MRTPLLIALLIFAQGQSVIQTIQLGYLVQDQRLTTGQEFRDRVAAVRLAVDDANVLLKAAFNVALNISTVAVTEDAYGVTTAQDFYKKGVAVFLGGSENNMCSGHAEAAGYLKIPFLSPMGCLSNSLLDKTLYPTFKRFTGISSAGLFLQVLLTANKITTFQPVALDTYTSTTASINAFFATTGITAQPAVYLAATATADAITQVVKQIRTRGYRWLMLLLNPTLSREFLIEMDRQNMNSGFTVVQLANTRMAAENIYDPTDTPERNARAARAAEGVWSIDLYRNVLPSYYAFSERLNNTLCSKGVLCFKTYDPNSRSSLSPIFAADAYDAVGIVAQSIFLLFNNTPTPRSTNLQLMGTQLNALMDVPFLGLAGLNVFAPNGERLVDMAAFTIRAQQDVMFSSFSVATGPTFLPVKLQFRGGDAVPPPAYALVPCDPGYFGTGGSDCTPCPVGRFSNTSGTTACTACPVGTHQASTQSTSCLICPSGSAARTAGLAECVSCDPATYAEKNGSAICDSCPSNTNNYQSLRLLSEGRLRNFVSNNVSDCFCLPGYSGPIGKACSLCDAGTSHCCYCNTDVATQIESLRNIGAPCAQCLSGVTVPMPKQGYALSQADNAHGLGRPASTVGAVIIPCHLNEACFGGPLSLCNEGYTGARCGKCDLGYSLQNNGACQKCPSSTTGLFVFLCIIPVIITITLLELSCRRVSLAALAIVNYAIDILFIISQIDFSWPDKISKIFVGTSLLNFETQLFYPDCAKAMLRNPYNQLGLTLSLPLVFLATHAGIFVIVIALRAITGNLGEAAEDSVSSRAASRLALFRLFSQPITGVLRTMAASMHRSMIIVFPQVTIQAIGFFKCYDLPDGASRSSLYAQLNCDSSEYRSIMWMPVLSIIMYNGVYPMACGLALRFNSRALATRRGGAYEIFWPFTHEFRKNVYAWGVLELFHFTMLAISVSVFKNALHQACAVIVLLVIHFLWCMRELPFKTKIDNDAQALMGLGIIAVVLCGIVADRAWTVFSVDVVDTLAVVIVSCLLSVIFYTLFRDIKVLLQHSIKRIVPLMSKRDLEAGIVPGSDIEPPKEKETPVAPFDEQKSAVEAWTLETEDLASPISLQTKSNSNNVVV